MKIILCIVLCASLLCGCQKSMGSFADGTIDMERYFEKLSEQIEENHWEMGLLNDEWWSKRKIEKNYHLDMTKVKESYVKSALMEAQLVEIAFFKIDKEDEPILKQAIQYRLTSLSSLYENYVVDFSKKLSHYKEVKIGEYYCFILGEDYKKVVNYIRNSE